MKVIYWDVVSPEEIGTSEFRRELEVPEPSNLRACGAYRAVAGAASELVDKADFAGLDSGIGQTATNYIEVLGEMFRVDKRVVVERIVTPLTTDPVSTKQLALPHTAEAPPAQTPPSVEDRVYQVIRSHAPDVKDLSPLTRVSTIGVGDSLALLELALGLEGEFGCGEITDEVLLEWVTIDDVVKCVEKMMLSQPAPPVEHQRPGVW